MILLNPIDLIMLSCWKRVIRMTKVRPEGERGRRAKRPVERRASGRSIVLRVARRFQVPGEPEQRGCRKPSFVRSGSDVTEPSWASMGSPEAISNLPEAGATSA